MSTRLAFACLCGAVAGVAVPRLLPPRQPADGLPLTLCHCTTCRRTSGVLCTSYCPIETPKDDRNESPLATLTAYSSSPSTTRFFCSTCGCHVFRRRLPSPPAACEWELTTGVVRDVIHDGQAQSPPALRLQYTRHRNVSATGDGGLAIWLPKVGDQLMTREDDDNCDDNDNDAEHTPVPGNNNTAPASLPAACHCGNVRFTVLAAATANDPARLAASRHPHSGFPDLLVPFATSDPDFVRNPDDVKWWLRPDPVHPGCYRYLAGTCACRTCRLATGFEIPTWTFVPRANIRLPGIDDEHHDRPLVFPGEPGSPASSEDPAPPPLPVATYRSRPDVERNFCPVCGATVFWHDTHRPDLVDVSVGLLRDPRGARAESFLDWCTTRVSFAEEAVRARSGPAAQFAATLIRSLGDGMKTSREHE